MVSLHSYRIADIADSTEANSGEQHFGRGDKRHVLFDGTWHDPDMESNHAAAISEIEKIQCAKHQLGALFNCGIYFPTRVCSRLSIARIDAHRAGCRFLSASVSF